MSNEDNKTNIVDSWVAWAEIKANIGDSWEVGSEAYANEGDTWKQFWSSAAPAGGDRGVFGGGDAALFWTNNIDYITISTTGNATYFGDLTVRRGSLGACANGGYDRGVFGGGTYSSTVYNEIDYITISSPSDATNFGDLTSKRTVLVACSNGSNDRGVFSSGLDENGFGDNTIDYITISSTGNATNFGDSIGSLWLYGSTSNGTNNRGVFGGSGFSGSNVIEYITISTPSNSLDFGDLTVIRGYRPASTSNTTNNRGIFIGGMSTGSNYVNTIDYITISSTGNATNFGDMTGIMGHLAATSNATNDRGVFAGGKDAHLSFHNIIEYVTISSLSDATDFGDLIAVQYNLAGTSNA